MAITTDTGAKKIENSENWRNIFGIHNDTVDAYDALAEQKDEEIGIVVKGNKTAHTGGAAAGQYIILRNSTITGCDDGLYKAAQAIPYDTAIDSTYLTPVSGGGLNALNASLTLISSTTGNSVIPIPDNVNQIIVLLKAGSEYATIQIPKGFYADYCANGATRANNNFYGFFYILNYSSSGVYLKTATNFETQGSVISTTEVRVYGK